MPRGFGASEPFVATYYFYWYDRASGMHFVDADGTDALTDHPAEPQGYSYRQPSWHRRELAAMVDAGIDVVLPVFWGNPADAAAASGPMRWSFDGLPPLVKAWQALDREGKHPSRIGLFYDTSSLRHNAAGRHVDLIRYAAWLIQERRRPKPARSEPDYEATKEAARARNARLSKAGRDIGEIPEVQHPRRRRKAQKGFEYFCKAYFPQVFHLPWSKDHLKAIARIEDAVLRGGLFAFAMPRGSGKT